MTTGNRTSEAHDGTVGTFTHQGKTYEIDWEEDPNYEDGRRNEMFGHIYLNGEHVGDCTPEFITEAFTSPGQVVAAAIAVIEAGETDDQD